MNLEQFKPLLPDVVFAELPTVVKLYEIYTRIRMAHFLAQCAHESAGFMKREENLNYSADRLLKVFPKYFDVGSAGLYARKPEKIANRVYANRMGNGDEASGDGWKFRGRGYFGLTGRYNYTEFGKSCGIDVTEMPSLVATELALTSAGWFWHVEKLNRIADRGLDQQDIADITKQVNGGYNGLEDRMNWATKFTLL